MVVALVATVKKANVAPTHPTVWIGLALAAVGLLVATFAYTGTRVYEIGYAFAALAGGLLALGGILTAAWGRSIMSARAGRARRGLIATDAKKLEEREDLPTVAAPKEKKRFAFGAKRKEKPLEAESVAGVFAFKRRAPDDPRPPASEPAPEPIPVVVTPAPAPAPAPADAKPVRVTLRCPQCSQQFSAEGVRPFAATCGNCGFSATV